MRNAFYVIISLVLSSCYVLNNPYDPQAANYNASLASSTSTSTVTIPAVTTSTTPHATTTTVASSTSTTSTTTTTVPSSGPIANGTYQLDNVGAGYAQQTDSSYVGASIYSCTTYTGASDQRWVVTAVGSYYEIASLSNGYAIAAGGASLITAVYTGADSQLWTITSLGGGKYQLVNKATGQSAHIKNDGTFSGNPMWLDTYSSGDTFFQWTFGAP